MWEVTWTEKYVSELWVGRLLPVSGWKKLSKDVQTDIRKRNRIVPDVFSFWIQWIPALSGEVKELGTKVTTAQTSHFQAVDRLPFHNFISVFICFGCAESSLLCGVFSICAEQGLLSIAVLRLLIVVASPVSEHGALGLWTSVIAACGLNSCSSWALDHSLISWGSGS